MPEKTESEIKFESYCEDKGILCEKIQEGEKPSADYNVFTENIHLICEVKQFDPNKEEVFREKEVKVGKMVMSECTPGHRVRKKIAKAGPQLRNLSEGKSPTMLVLYNNIITVNHADPYFVKVGMYGVETIDIAVPHDMEQKSYVTGKRFGAKKKMTEHCNTSISAVAVLDCSSGTPCLSVYHNEHAQIPLDPESIRILADKQFVLDEKVASEFQGWREI